jgi:hypothetical protein
MAVFDRKLKHIGKRQRDILATQNRDNEQMRVRCLESVFGNGNTERLIDVKKVNWKHVELLRKFGYTERLVNIGSIILTDKAFADWDTICQERLFKKID